MLKLQSFFKNYSHLGKDYSQNIKPTEKSIEGLGKNRNISLDFSNTPIKQNKKLIKRNTRTNSFNSLIINQTEGGFFPPYSYMTKLNENKNNQLTKGLLGFKPNHQKNKSFNIKKGLFNLNNKNIVLKKKSQKKKCKRNFLNSYFINPNNVHISFNTVGNNFQIESQHSRQNNKNNFNHNSNNIINKASNNSELNKSLSNMSKIKRINKKLNSNNSSNNNCNYNNNIIINEINNLISSLSEEKQKLFLNEFKLYLNILNKIKKNKNNNDMFIGENEIEEIQKSGGQSIIGNILCQNYKLKKENEKLESKINNIMKEIEEIKKDKKNTEKEITNKNEILKELNNKINTFNSEMNKMKNILLNLSNKSQKNNDISFLNKSSQGDLENISIADNSNINIEDYKNVLNKDKKNNKQIKRNKSGNNLKNKDDVGILNFSSKVGNYNFNDEFLKNYEYFSDSWRREADKMLQRRGIKLNNNDGK